MLDNIFTEQDNALRGHRQHPQVAALLQICSEATAAYVGLLAGGTFPDEKQLAFRVIGSEVITSCAVAARASLWGCQAEAFASLRPSIELATLLQWIAAEGLYSDFCRELIARRFRKVTFEAASVALKGEVGDLPRIYGEFSNLGSHVSAKRLLGQCYILNGQTVDRVGYAFDVNATLLPLRFVPAPLIQCLLSLAQGYGQEGRGAQPGPVVGDLFARYREARAALRQSPA